MTVILKKWTPLLIILLLTTQATAAILKYKRTISVETPLWTKAKKLAKDWSPTAAVGTGAVVLAPIVVGAAGFTSAGITAGSLGAKLMTMSALANGGGVPGFTSAGITAGSLGAKLMTMSALANGGGVPAGGLIATLQSAGAAGITVSGKVAIGSVAGATYKSGESIVKLIREFVDRNKHKAPTDHA